MAWDGPPPAPRPTPSPSGADRPGGATPAPRFFARSSFWNAPLGRDAALDPRSDRLAAELRRQVDREREQRNGPWIATSQYSTPIYTVPARQRTVRVKLDTYTPSNLESAFAAVPIPRGARPAAGRDAHMTVWQPSRDRMWEFWRLARRSDGWHASWGGAMRDVSRSPGHYTRASWPGAEPYWGSTASKLPVVGGTVTIEELERGRIDHALALGVPEVRAEYVSWPAQRTDGTARRAGAIPQGARFRIDPKLDIAALDLPPITRMLAEAAQRHGMVVRDRSGTVAFYAEDPTPRRTNPYPELIGPLYYPDNINEATARFPWEHVELLRMDLHRQER